MQAIFSIHVTIFKIFQKFKKISKIMQKLINLKTNYNYARFNKCLLRQANTDDPEWPFL